MNIQWYPGHMEKTKRMIKSNLSMVDLVIEILDARIPVSSKNPDLDKIINNKPKLVVLNKSDLSDPVTNNSWKIFFDSNNIENIFIDSITGKGIKKITEKIENLMEERLERLSKRGVKNKSIRCMVLGIPNVGKSTFINKIIGKASAKTGNKPGVTRGKQWIKISNKIELLDMPGILWPKFEDKSVSIKLAWIGSIKDEILNKEELALKLIEFLAYEYPELLMKRYKLDEILQNDMDIYLEIARKRGFILKGGEMDYHRTAEMLLDEFRKGKIGRISLEKPQDFN